MNLDKLKPSKYFLEPVSENKINIKKNISSSEQLYLISCELVNNKVIFYLSENFDNWYVNAKKDDKDELLFSLMFAKDLLSIKTNKGE